MDYRGRGRGVVHELTKNSSHFDCDYTTRENLNLLLNKSSRNYGIENRVVEISKLRQLQYMWAFLTYYTIQYFFNLH